MDNSIRKSVILTLGQLGANQTSTYGNTVFRTENLNQLAACSLLFEQAHVQKTDAGESYQRLAEVAEFDGLRNAGVGTTFLTDDAKLLDHPWLESFDQVVALEFDPADGLADSPESTELAQVMAQLADWLNELPDRHLAWIHLRGLAGAWDAPYRWREERADDEDPEPPRFFEPPAMLHDPQRDDPDVLLGVQQACAAQVQLIDHWLGVLVYQLQQPAFSGTLFSLSSMAGFPLGEHGAIGQTEAIESQATSAACHNEAHHVPWLVWFTAPESQHLQATQLVRCQSLVDPLSVWGIANDYLVGDEQALGETLRTYVDRFPQAMQEQLLLISEGVVGVQTHAWKLIWSPDSDEAKLYAKPDDLWEVNDVSRRCPEIVEALRERLTRQLQNPDQPFEPLPESLALRE